MEGAPPLPPGGDADLPAGAAPAAAPVEAAAPPPPPHAEPPPPPDAAPGPSAPPPPPPDDADGAAAPPPPPPPEAEDDDDPLVAARRARDAEDARAAELEAGRDVRATDDPLLREFYGGLRDVDRENEVFRVLGAFKLNPFEKLGLRFDAPPEEVPRAYRKASLMVHPDKCAHERAKEAFELLGDAQRELLDAERRRGLDFLLAHAREEVLKEWRRAAKRDAAAKVAALLDEAGRAGVEAAYTATPEFHAAWKAKARDVLARAEWRKRKLTKRLGEEEERAKEEYRAEKEAARDKAKADKAWEASRDGRVGSWRDFAAGAKKARGLGLKPPKSKAADEERRYVQRPVGAEAQRPPPPPARR